MPRPRVEATRLRELIRLRRAGVSARQATRALSMSPRTERRYRRLLGAAGLWDGSPNALPGLAELRAAVSLARPVPKPVPSTVAPWSAQVRELVRLGLGPRAVFDRLQLEHEFPGSYSAVKRYLRRQRATAGVRAEDVAIPLATTPGAEAQVDFGYAGQLYDPARGKTRRAWVFVMVLCHSRHMFARLVFDQRTETWLGLHEQAFAFFGGVVETLVPDNTRRAVLRAAFGLDGPCELERSYRELALAYGFKIDPAPPGDPRKRGKVEAAVKYLRHNPLKGREGQSIHDVQAALDCWNLRVAGQRIHGTTGLRPLEAFADEQPHLRPLPAERPKRVVWKQAKVHTDAHVSFRGRLYSVPWQLLHERVWIRAAGRRVEVLHQDRVVASHLDQGLRRTTCPEHLPADRGAFRERSRAHWLGRAHAIGPEAEAFVREQFDQDAVLSYLRAVQATVKHLECFPAHRAESVSRRARGRGDYSYQGIKQALAAGLDLQEEVGTVQSGQVCEACGGQP